MLDEHPMWVAGQTDHNDWPITIPRYGRWMPDSDGWAGRRVEAVYGMKKGAGKVSEAP